jgi:hypothetical protein
MNDWYEESDRASVAKIVEHLRMPVKFDDTFDVRVMSAVHAEALARVDAQHAQRSAEESNGAWWSRRYTVRFSALGGLAMAASIFGVIFLGSSALSRQSPATTVNPAVNVATQAATPVKAKDVHFILVDGSADQVWLVGDFNGWARTSTPLTRAANGNAWTVSLPLQEGRHEYAFIVSDGENERWVADPLTRVVEDEFGTESSVVRVNAAEAAATE